MSDETLERELKLQPQDPGLLDRLAAVEYLGPFSVAGRRRELQRNTFFDSASRALTAARLGFRRRTIAGEPLATWTLKGNGHLLRGVSTRTEIEARLDLAASPVFAIEALRRAARERGAAALAEQLGEALSVGGFPLASPLLETETERTLLDLEAVEQGWCVELALDRVRLIGHAYAELEIEVELKRGDEAALDAAREAIAALGPTHDSQTSKLSRALHHIQSCTGCTLRPAQ